MTTLDHIHVADGDFVATEHICAALTAAGFVYEDGSTQVFDPAGATSYLDQGRSTQGEWYVGDDGRFCSFWPPNFRACYDLHWIVEDGRIVGLRFHGDDRRSSFNGRYRQRR